MAKGITLKAQMRTEVNGKAKQLLNKGFVPAVVYGSGAVNTILKVNMHDLEHAYKIAGESNLINLVIGDQEPVKALIKEVQKGGLKNNLIHVDFYKVDMKKKITIEIPLNFIGESKAVKELGGTFIKNLDTVEVECLPGDIVKDIDVDISPLQTFEDVIKLGDLKIPEDIKLVNQKDLIIASVIEPKEEIEEVKEEMPAEAGAAEEEAGQEKVEEKKG